MTPFDKALTTIALARYHNHRQETHSNTVSEGLFEDLVARCESLRADLDAGTVKKWINVSSPGDRKRKVDLFVGEPGPTGKPQIDKVRIAIENKSVVTAHRNRTNRFDDLHKVLGAIHEARPEALLVATVLVGLCPQVLNVPDRIKPMFKGREDEFGRDVLPRLSSGDSSLWSEFPYAISENKPNDPAKTVALMRTLPVRQPGHTHVVAYDHVMLVPVEIDNVNPPSLPRPNALGIDVDAEYDAMLSKLCAAYTARWHI